MDLNVLGAQTGTGTQGINLNELSSNMLIGTHEVVLINIESKLTRATGQQVLHFIFATKDGRTADVSVFVPQLAVFMNQCRIAFKDMQAFDNNQVAQALQEAYHRFAFIAPIRYNSNGGAMQFHEINWIETIKANMIVE